MSFDLSGQTALVTGGAQGIGEGIVVRLAKAGAEVAVADLAIDRAGEVAERLGREGAKAYPVALDVSERASVEAAVAEVVEKSGQLDILVNNAGIAGRAAPIWEQEDEGLVKSHRRQPHRRLFVLPGRDAPHARTRLRPHRQYRFPRG